MPVNETISLMFLRNPGLGSQRRIFISQILMQVEILKSLIVL